MLAAADTVTYHENTGEGEWMHACYQPLSHTWPWRQPACQAASNTRTQCMRVYEEACMLPAADSDAACQAASNTHAHTC